MEYGEIVPTQLTNQMPGNTSIDFQGVIDQLQELDTDKT